MPLIWEYSQEAMAEMAKWSPPSEERIAQFEKDKADRLARIDKRVNVYVNEQREKAMALAWCRANGNPHLGERDAQAHKCSKAAE